MNKGMRRIGIAIILVVLLTTTVMGQGLKQTIDVYLNHVNLTVNGQKVEVDNMLYNGTTYVPLRAVAEALGKEMGWDENTNTASINDSKNVKPPNQIETEETEINIGY